MVSRSDEGLNRIFDELADTLNISETMCDKAERAYRALGDWLGKNSEGKEVQVYTQGSFALGTVVRPPSGEDLDYDIDLVCELPDMTLDTARNIKWFVGNRIGEHATYAAKLEPEGKRCWTLDYGDFHVDVLPCTGDVQRGGTAIRLTHKDRATGRYENRYSDPRGYAKWFEGQMGESLLEAKRKRLGAVFCSVDDVPTFAVRTPLQKSVQILKHHRNVMFEGLDDAPISIIISTLAAQAYDGEGGTYDAVIGILDRMSFYIQGNAGAYRIPNPVDEKENFADRWNEEPGRARAFFAWLQQAQEDFYTLSSIHGLDEIGRALESSCGKIVATRTMNAYGEGFQEARNSGELFAASAGLTFSGSPATTVVPRHEFYGD